MPSSKSSSATSLKRHHAVKIKHGKAPEVQEVNIRSTKQVTSDERTARPPTAGESPKKRSKSMTTRSTMTNEDDYTVVHTNTPCTTPASSVRGDHVIDDVDMSDVIGQKMVGWKMTPRVHFPPPNTINASSLRTSEARQKMLPQDDGKRFLKINKIDPPFIHRPDRTLVVHQTLPLPMEPVKAWPGYCGNVYFNPFRVDSMSIGDRTFSPTKSYGARSRSQATSRTEFATATPDGLSYSKTTSFAACSSPSLTSTKRFAGRNTPSIFGKSFATFEDKDEAQQRRPMAQLDKSYVLGLNRNPKLNEDWSWISGMESLGSLKIGNPLNNVQRQSTNETFTRHSVVEKVPHNFVFHPSKNANKSSRDKSHAIALKRYSQKYGVSETALKQFIDRYYRDNQGVLHLPMIPLRVSGKSVSSDKTPKKYPANLYAL